MPRTTRTRRIKGPRTTRTLLVLVAALALLAGCEREARRYQELPAAANRETAVRVGQLEPGAPQQNASVRSPYQDNAWGIGEGKRLYGAYNCAPCHGANGGGAIGPPLMDEKWIYGSAPEQIFNTIVQGRPNGMPSFAGKIPTPQVWELVAYVRSLSAQNSTGARSARSDHMMMYPGSGSLQDATTPVKSFHPPAAEMP